MKERGGLLMILTGPGRRQILQRLRRGGPRARLGTCASASCQFIKGKWQTGEKHFFRRFPDLVTFEVMGEGFTWDVQDRQRDIAAAQKAWQRSCELIVDPEYDFVLLDELNIAIRNDYISIDEVVVVPEEPAARQALSASPGAMRAPQLTEIADLVTEMTLVKHPYEAGFKPQRGVEF